jgi:hypothetical protein
MSNNKEYQLGWKYHNFGMDYLGDREQKKEVDEGWLSPLRPPKKDNDKKKIVMK